MIFSDNMIFSQYVEIYDIVGGNIRRTPMRSDFFLFSENQRKSNDMVINFDFVKKLHKQNHVCKRYGPTQ